MFNNNTCGLIITSITHVCTYVCMYVCRWRVAQINSHTHLSDLPQLKEGDENMLVLMIWVAVMFLLTETTNLKVSNNIWTNTTAVYRLHTYSYVRTYISYSGIEARVFKECQIANFACIYNLLMCID